MQCHTVKQSVVFSSVYKKLGYVLTVCLLNSGQSVCNFCNIYLVVVHLLIAWKDSSLK